MTKYKHRPCPCGCGELADECMNPKTGIGGAFQIEEPLGSNPLGFVTCWRSECRSGCFYPTVCTEVPR